MSARSAYRLAWSLCGISLALLGVALILILLGFSTPLSEGWEPWWRQGLWVAGVAGAPVLGGLIASRRPENPYGWLWLGFGISLSVLQCAQVYAAYGLAVEPGLLPGPRTVGSLATGWGFAAVVTLLSLLLLLFPDGRPPSRLWRIQIRGVAAAGTALVILVPFVPGASGFGPYDNPLGVGGAAGEFILALLNVLVISLFLATVPAAISLVFRFRRAGGIERQQIKWFAYAAAVFASLVPLDIIGGVSELLGEALWDVLNILTFAGLYAAVGIAILRYRLYEIDRLINRTLVYGALTVSLALLYFGGVVLMQGAFRALTGQGSDLAVVASTLAIAALFNPLRRRIQSFIDRLFYRKKYDAAKTLAAFSARLRDEAELERVSGDLLEAVRETVQPEHVSLWLRDGSENSRRLPP